MPRTSLAAAAGTEGALAIDAPTDTIERLRALVAIQLGVSADSLSVAAPLEDQGFDSLMGAELAGAVLAELGTRISVSEITVSSIAALAEAVTAGAPEPATERGAPETEQSVPPGLTDDAIDQMSDEELDALLAAELSDPSRSTP